MAFGSESEDSETRTSVLNDTPCVHPQEQLNTEKKKFTCTFEGCSASFSRAWKLTAHDYIHTGEKGFTCDHEGCQKSFKSSTLLRRHKSKAHSFEENSTNKKYKCRFPDCEVELKTRLLEKRHFKRIHVCQFYKCSWCKEEFKKRSALREHLFTHTGGSLFNCEKCGQNFNKSQEYKRHLKKHKTHTCQVEGCNQSFSRWTLYRSHCSTVHKPEFTCDHCSKIFKRKWDLKQHILRHLKEFESRNEASLESSADGNSKQSEVKKIKKEHVCNVEGCGAKFSRPWRLASHISYVHLGKKGFDCDFEGCNKSYTTEYHLHRHRNIAHFPSEKEPELVKCEFPRCGIEVKNKYHLARHIKWMHTLKKVYPCSECESSFMKHSQLSAHMYIHTGVPPLLCEVCNTGFVTPRELRKHSRGHRTYTCQVNGCKESFTKWSLMMKHRSSVHPRVFTCHYCSKTCKRKSDIRFHIVRHLESMYGKKLKDRKKNYLKLHTCDICQNQFKGKASLQRHVRNVHERTPAEREAMKKRAEERKAKGRAKRKDAGIAKKSLAVVLSEVEPLIPPEIHKRLIDREEIIISPEKDEKDTALIILNHLQF